MKLSLCNEVIREMPFAAQCDFAAGLGYDALEIAPFTLGPEPHRLTARDIAACRKAMADAGIVCSSLHWLLVAPEGLSITSEDAQVHGRTVDVMRRLTGLAAELGADALVHGSPKQRVLSPGREAEGRARALAAFQAAGEAAAEAGVFYCIEPLAREETDFVNTVGEAAAIIDDLACPGLRTMVDCAATLLMGDDPAQVLDRELPGGLIAHVQVNDANRRGPGEGGYAMGPLFRTLRKHGYDGWVAAEPFVYVPDGPACAARAIGYLKGVLEELE